MRHRDAIQLDQQFYNVYTSAQNTPERDLLAAMIYRGIRDLLYPRKRKRAMLWFEYTGEDVNDGFTFRQCCAFLGWDRLKTLIRLRDLYAWIEEQETRGTLSNRRKFLDHAPVKMKEKIIFPSSRSSSDPSQQRSRTSDQQPSRSDQ